MKVTRTSDKFYMQFPPPKLKKKDPPMCVHIQTRIHTIHTHCTHIHTLPALCSHCHAFKQLHPPCSLLSRLTSVRQIVMQLRHKEETFCMATRMPRGPVCLFIFLSLWEKLQSPKVQQHQGQASLPHRRHPAAPQPTPRSRYSCLEVGRQQPVQDNVKKATHIHTHPPIQIIK